jgi:hypothetical protein
MSKLLTCSSELHTPVHVESSDGSILIDHWRTVINITPISISSDSHETYQCIAYFCGPQCKPHPSLVYTTRMSSNSNHIELNVPYIIGSTVDTLMIAIFVTAANRDEGSWITQRLLGTCTIHVYPMIYSLDLNVRFNIVSSNGTPQGVITMQSQHALVNMTVVKRVNERPSAAADTKTYINRLIDTIGSSKQVIQSKPMFATVSYNGYTIPTCVFIQAQLQSLRVDPSHLDSLISHWLSIACSCHSITVDEFIHLNTKHTTVKEVIGFMFTLPFKGLVYNRDSLRTSVKTETIGTDQWMSLFQFPDPTQAGFDCEDSSITILQLVKAVKDAKFTTPLCTSLQSKLDGLVACSILGQILDKDKYILHSYTALVHKSWFGVLGSKDSYVGDKLNVEPIIMEGTNSLASVYTRDTMNDADALNAYDTEDSSIFNNNNALGDDYRYVVHSVEAPTSKVVNTKLYGYVHSLIACHDHKDHKDQEVTHYVLTNKDNEIGVSFKDFVSNQIHDMEYVNDITIGDLSTYAEYVNEMMPSKLPDIPSSSTTLHALEPACRRMFTRVVNDGRQSVIDKSIMKHASNVVKRTRIEIVKGLFVDFYDYSPN